MNVTVGCQTVGRISVRRIACYIYGRSLISMAHLEREVAILRGFLKGLPSGVKILAGSLPLNGVAITLLCSSEQPHPFFHVDLVYGRERNPCASYAHAPSFGA